MRLPAASLCLAVSASTAISSPSGDCTRRRTGWAAPADGIPHLAIVNRIVTSRGRALRWNGQPINRETLREYLGLVRAMEPMPFTILTAGPGVDCAFLEAIRDDMARALPCELGACGEGRGRWNDAPPVQLDTNSAAYRELDREAERAVANAAQAKPER